MLVVPSPNSHRYDVPFTLVLLKETVSPLLLKLKPGAGTVETVI